eukprot:gnl/Dysnectes_brevis/2105_a2442_2017.p1 GENE.gnl/Dysnectes_brevis/2105_a2442_2017~~gnl/Dysnectes_brevis/2105_a2442_2017.p1  ORF type:complete len:759 (+),score=246.56 gnl/Dysnectes_brevis/2105_a2442_2017:45-2321(+)
MKLQELSKFSAAMQSPGSPTQSRRVRTPFSRGPAAHSSTHGLIARAPSATIARVPDMDPEEYDDSRLYTADLQTIRSSEELKIDTGGRALRVKRGDLSIIQGEVFLCNPIASHLSHLDLIVKRLECVDRRTYDLKVYEADVLERFKGHPNLTNLYSYWSEKPLHPYTYKTLILLMEYGSNKDMFTTVVQNPVRPSPNRCLVFAADLLKGLVALHNCNIIHGRVKPSSIYLHRDGRAILGEFGRTELDSARQTHQLFSKVLIGEAISHTLVYWAPELLTLKKYGKEIDIWALGVSLYQLATGQHPFDTTNENTFRDDALTVNVNWGPLADEPGHRLLGSVIRGCLQLDPEERLSAADALKLVQVPFAVKIQRAWRRYRWRRNWQAFRSSTVTIQSYWRMALERRKYKTMLNNRRENSARTILAWWRGSEVRGTMGGVREAIHQCQANIQARRTVVAFQQIRGAITKAAAHGRGLLMRNWFKKYRSMRNELVGRLLSVQAMVHEYNKLFVEFEKAVLSKTKTYPVKLERLRSFEHFELTQAGDDTEGCLPQLQSAAERLTSLQSENEDLRARLARYEVMESERQEEDSMLRERLGSKYQEMDPMIDALKENLHRIELQCRQAVPLNVAIAHEYQYSRWERHHEPENRVENVLDDDERQYRALQPSIDLSLEGSSRCFVSEVSICPGDCGPSACEVYVAAEPERYVLVNTFPCNRDGVQTFPLSGEQTDIVQVRLRFPQNIRGGNIVSIRHVGIRGLVLTE